MAATGRGGGFPVRAWQAHGSLALVLMLVLVHKLSAVGGLAKSGPPARIKLRACDNSIYGASCRTLVQVGVNAMHKDVFRER